MRLFRDAIAGALAVLVPAASVAQQPQSAASVEIRQALKEGEAGQGTTGRRYVLGEKLTADSERRHAFDVETDDNYLALGVCDDVCGDIDVVVEDASGNVLGNDEAYGADPFVVFSPQNSGRVSIVILMKECDEDLCEYGLGFYSLAERGETSE